MIYRIPIFFKRGPLKIINMFLLTLVASLSIVLLKGVDLVYERARIFGAPAILVGWVLRKKSIYELNEPVVDAPVLTGRMKEGSLSYKVLRGWYFFTARRATLITATHRSIAAGLPGEKCMIIHYGANPAKFHPEVKCDEIRERYGLVEGKTVLYVGSFRPWHQCENIIYAAKRVVKQDGEVKFLMMGKGDRFEECKKLIEELRLKNNVLLVGEVPYEESPAYVNASDICLALFNKNYELFKEFDYFYSPIKVHEYKACGKPVIASDMGNLKELVRDGINGVLVDSSDVLEIENAIIALITNVEGSKKIGERNRKETIEKYSWDLINQGILSELSKSQSCSNSRCSLF